MSPGNASTAKISHPESGTSTPGRMLPLFSRGNFTGKNVRSDLMAGIVVTVLLIPQAMGYALLAGLPPIVGLYAATVPLIAYALLGSSRQLSVGPVAMASLIIFSICSKVAQPGTPEYITAAAVAAGLSGVILLLLGFFRAGNIINFVSDTVIHGFTAAAALIIVISQLPHLFGISAGESSVSLVKLWNIVAAMPSLSISTTLLGIGGIAWLLVDRFLINRRTGPIVLVAVAILLVYLFRLDLKGVAIIGRIPGGLPPFQLHGMELETILQMLPGTLSLSLVGFLESVAVAKILAEKHRYRIEPDRELIGLGCANVVSYLFSGYAVTGGFSRSVVNDAAGARTQLASVITALLILSVLFFFTGVLYYLPKAALAAIVIVAVANLFHFTEGFKLFKLNRPDGLTYFLTFFITLGIGIEPGIITGVIFSLLIFVWRSAHPHIVESISQGGRDVHGSPAGSPDTVSVKLSIKIVGPLFFANMRYLEAYFEKRHSEIERVNMVYIDFSGIYCMDAVALRRLEKLIDNYHNRHVAFRLGYVNESIRRLAQRAGWDDKPWGPDLIEKEPPSPASA